MNIAVELPAHMVEALVEAVSPDFYVRQRAVATAVAAKSSFNLVDRRCALRSTCSSSATTPQGTGSGEGSGRRSRLERPARVARLLRETFPASRFLSVEGAAELLARFGDGEIAGGAVYDALVGAVAIEHRRRLATLDRRALDTYRVLRVEVELLD